MPTKAQKSQTYFICILTSFVYLDLSSLSEKTRVFGLKLENFHWICASINCNVFLGEALHVCELRYAFMNCTAHRAEYPKTNQKLPKFNI